MAREYYLCRGTPMARPLSGLRNRQASKKELAKTVALSSVFVFCVVAAIAISSGKVLPAPFHDVRGLTYEDWCMSKIEGKYDILSFCDFGNGPAHMRDNMERERVERRQKQRSLQMAQETMNRNSGYESSKKRAPSKEDIQGVKGSEPDLNSDIAVDNTAQETYYPNTWGGERLKISSLFLPNDDSQPLPKSQTTKEPISLAGDTAADADVDMDNPEPFKPKDTHDETVVPRAPMLDLFVT
mmetsp:Transcript_27561/g.67039  ORF Transcript_27561/g.67039 Transcript_27561/m.67039 type:complete len:241 (-) Transcript_27561:235-957(-)